MYSLSFCLFLSFAVIPWSCILLCCSWYSLCPLSLQCFFFCFYLPFAFMDHSFGVIKASCLYVSSDEILFIITYLKRQNLKPLHSPWINRLIFYMHVWFCFSADSCDSQYERLLWIWLFLCRRLRGKSLSFVTSYFKVKLLNQRSGSHVPESCSSSIIRCPW